MKTKKKQYAKLVGLPGVKRKNTRAVVVRSVTAASKELREGNAVMAADDCGSINVWKADDGIWRCEFQRYRMTVSEATFKWTAAVVEWLRTWFPKMRKNRG